MFLLIDYVKNRTNSFSKEHLLSVMCFNYFNKTGKIEKRIRLKENLKEINPKNPGNK